MSSVSRSGPLGAQVAVLAGCPDCGGSGAAVGTVAHQCQLCRGAGEILKNRKVNDYGEQRFCVGSYQKDALALCRCCGWLPS